VTAVIVLRDGVAPSPELASGIQDFVRHRLAAHSYPRRIVFAPSLPLTATGKVRRGELRAALGSNAAQEDA
jgi:acetyl-CoA synthetase